MTDPLPRPRRVSPGRLRGLVLASGSELAVMVIYGSSLVFTAIGAVLAARLLDTAEYGRFNTAGAYITIAAAAAAAGHGDRAMRTAARPVEGSGRDQRAQLVFEAFLARLPVVLLVTLPLGLFSQVDVWVTLAISLPTAVLLATAQVLEAFTRGLLGRVRDLVPYHVGNPVTFAAVCLAGLAVGVSTDAVGLLAVRFGLMAGIVAYFVRRLDLRLPSRRSDRAGLEPLTGFALASVLFTVQGQISIIVAGMISDEAAGLYTAAFRAATTVGAATTALAILAGPAVAAAAQAGRLAEVIPRVRSYGRLGAALALVPATVLVIWPDLVLGLFGDDFERSADTLRVLTVAQLVISLFGPSLMLATMGGIERSVAAWMGAAVVVQATLSLGLLAADELTVLRLAWLDSLGTLTWVLGVWWACRRRLGATAAVLGA